MAVADVQAAPNAIHDRYRTEMSTVLIAALGLVLSAVFLFIVVDPGVIQDWFGTRASRR
ncbi:MAG: hypothetical protein AAFO77_02100 [Pseudomonadota bacterium]